jgi:primosomal protein N' (replication factor Y)
VQPSQATFRTSTVESDSTVVKYAEVAVPLHVFQTFVYRIPATLVELAAVGSRIVVPLGRSVVAGYIVALSETPPVEQYEFEVKDATEILDSIPVVTSELIELTRWVAEYYGAPWGEAIKAALPPGISPSINQFLTLTSKGREQAELSKASSSTKETVLRILAESGEVELSSLTKLVGEPSTIRTVRELERLELIKRAHRPSSSFVRTKTQKIVRLLDASEPKPSKLTGTQQRIIDALEKSGSMTLKDLMASTEVSVASINTLAKKGLIKVYEEPLRRDPLAGDGLPVLQNYKLTDAQTVALNAIEQSLRNGDYAPYLLHGVTGSGKTEVYIRAMRLALELGRGAMMMVPEIALTPVFSRRLRVHFGDRVAIFHSSLSRGERFDEWTRVRNGEARVVIGTRSAVFAPVQNLGLVVVDEEHESSYRQQESPQYNGRDTAIVRAQKESAVVVLGSATPSLESYHNSRTGKYRYLQLAQRIANRPMAAATLIDMRQVFDRHKRPRVFSEELLQAIEETQAKGEQAIILLNRRGYSSFVLCRTCGETIQCPNCDVTLTYHRSERVILCHYCNHREAAPTKCPSCEGKYIYYVGEGTEQIEEMLKRQFPSLRIARIDRDTTARRKLFEKSLTDFSEGRLDMLVGTQMLAKGHDYPNVTLVGVVSVDLGLALPDFRAAERTFQLITQVAGRAGRGDRAGQVLIQTYHPHHYALLHASAQDYQGFYDEEIRHRQNLGYPPFVSLASLLVHGPELGRVRAEAMLLRKALDRANPDRTCRILGPAPAPLARLKGEHRFQLLAKSRSRRQLRALADNALRDLGDQGVNLRSIKLEIDPVSVM